MVLKVTSQYEGSIISDASSATDSAPVPTPSTSSFDIATPSTEVYKQEKSQGSSLLRYEYTEAAFYDAMPFRRALSPVEPLSPEQEAAVRDYVENFTAIDPRARDRDTPEIQIKALMLGQYEVGMSALQIIKDLWLIGYDPTKHHGYGTTTTRLLYGKRVRFQMLVDRPNPQWSVESWPRGHEPSYIEARHCEALILVYDVRSRASFEAIKSYHRNLRQEWSKPRGDCGNCYQREGGCPPRPPFQGLTFVFANRINRDKGEWEVSLPEGQQLAASIGPRAEFAPMSALTGEGCRSADVSRMVKQIIERRTQRPPSADERAERVDWLRKLYSKMAQGPLTAYHHSQLSWY